MSILSFKFWVLFPILFLFYWLLPKRWAVVRRVFLILVSYAMYMSFKPAYALILIGLTVITYFGALLVGGAVVRRRGLLIWSLSLLVLLPLIVFKYWNFLNGSLSDVFAGISLPGLNWAIPVGISFFTFQALGYLLDVYYRRIEPETSFVNYTLFVCFFPQIASGPISKASEMLPQIAKIGTGSSDISWSPHQMSDNKIVTGGGQILALGIVPQIGDC